MPASSSDRFVVKQQQHGLWSGPQRSSQQQLGSQSRPAGPFRINPLTKLSAWCPHVQLSL
ncbi:hypothetical protein E4U61_002667 [Claviceps capensis]|nr:hypothetical protein E4U61_002667 [Claviceps capensis]